MRVDKCKGCGGSMFDPGAKKYCSNACRQKCYRQRLKAKRAPVAKPDQLIHCRYCGKSFQATNPRREYCSANHKKQNYREQRQLRELAEMEARLRTWTAGSAIERSVLEYA